MPRRQRAMPLPIRADRSDDGAIFKENPMSINIVPADVMPVRRGGRFRTVMVSATLILIAASVAGCSKKVARTPDPRPVRTVTVESQADGETVSFTGQIRAKDQVNLAFRLDGRVIERHVNLGRRDRGRPGRGQARPPEPAERAALRRRPTSPRRRRR